MPTKRGLPTKGDHLTTEDGVLIATVLRRVGEDLQVQRPGRKIVSTVKNWKQWQEQYNWRIK